MTNLSSDTQLTRVNITAFKYQELNIITSIKYYSIIQNSQ